LYRDELLARVTSLSDTVGFSLARGVFKAVASVDDASKIRNMAKLSMVFEKLQDLVRGVERLQTAIGKCGVQRYSALCRELNLASESLDDVPDRATLRRLVQTLKAEAASNQSSESTEGARIWASCAVCCCRRQRESAVPLTARSAMWFRRRQMVRSRWRL
jgi:hypothetical protein